MDRFIGTGSGNYSRQQRRIRTSLSVPGSSSPCSSPNRIKKGLSRSLLSKKRQRSTEDSGTRATEETSDVFPNESVPHTIKSEFSPNLIIVKNDFSPQRSPEIQATKPAFVTFDNNARFRIPILGENHPKNNNSIQRDKDDIMMDIITHTPSGQSTNIEVNIQINMKEVFIWLSNKIRSYIIHIFYSFFFFRQIKIPSDTQMQDHKSKKFILKPRSFQTPWA